MSRERLEELLKDWNDTLAVHDVQDAEEIIHLLQIELAGKEAVIRCLQEQESE